MKKNFLFFVFVFILYGEEIKVLFTPSKKTYFEFIDLLQKAEKSIYISTFSISSEFVKFLENKKIDIKILCEYSDIKNFNIKKIKKKGIFHSKFIIIDEKVSIITSANLTFTNFYKNHNNLVIIENENVAKYLLG
ncbi:MAG: phospholipase D family protein, partial [bacterium]|nr:phospholipase D family protein [bacterium]MDW8163814.1 phospholipase D family protein [Candidatus Omnitrophota bacterium]